MKKFLVSICIVSAAFAMSSCRTIEKAAPLSSINGDWTIVEVNGIKVPMGDNGEAPFISFDTNTGKLSGNSGCNRMMGGFDINAKAGELSLKQIGSTRMMCADMNTENAVLGALSQVEMYKTSGDNKLILCNSSKRPVAILERKKAETGIAVLNGEWNITEVNGEVISKMMEKQPFITFDVKKNLVHGNAGCNLINGEYKTEKNNAKSISFPALMTTMMACPDLETEGKILKALNETKTFGQLAGGGIGFYDASDALVLTLEK